MNWLDVFPGQGALPPIFDPPHRKSLKIPRRFSSYRTVFHEMSAENRRSWPAPTKTPTRTVTIGELSTSRRSTNTRQLLYARLQYYRCAHNRQYERSIVSNCGGGGDGRLSARARLRPPVDRVHGPVISGRHGRYHATKQKPTSKRHFIRGTSAPTAPLAREYVVDTDQFTIGHR